MAAKAPRASELVTRRAQKITPSDAASMWLLPDLLDRAA
jgi:hypothetical protein